MICVCCVSVARDMKPAGLSTLPFSLIALLFLLDDDVSHLNVVAYIVNLGPGIPFYW